MRWAQDDKVLCVWKPDWLYKAMPLKHAAAGLVAPLYLGMPPGTASGVLLVAAAARILERRHAGTLPPG